MKKHYGYVNVLSMLLSLSYTASSNALPAITYPLPEINTAPPPDGPDIPPYTVPRAHGASVANFCYDAQREAELRVTEKEMLGHGHADEHARARAESCALARQAMVERGFKHSDDAFERAAKFVERIKAAADIYAGDLAQLIGKAVGTAHAATGAPDQVGRWSAPTPLPVVGIHSVLLPTGKVLFWSYRPPKTTSAGVAYVWSPITGTGRRVDPPSNIWCGGQTLLADGRVLVVGGTLAYASPTELSRARGLNQIYTFNPFGETWTRQPNMRLGRWYPTITRLTNGSVVITSGLTESGGVMNTDVEVFTPSPSMNGVGTVRRVGTRGTTGLYPHQFLMPDGRVLMGGPGVADTAILNPRNWTWADIPNLKQPRYGYGSGTLLPGGAAGSTKVMLIGGRSSTVVFATSEQFDTLNPGAGWQFRAPMPQPRHNHNTVILPDGTLLTVGGNSSTDYYANPQRETLLYDPVVNAWRAMATQAESRAYHSTALLLPDGRVMSAGDDGATGGGASTDKVEIFSPPYLFRGTRPTISFAPNAVARGKTFTIGTPDSISKVVLVTPGATTHANDMHQRLIALSFTAMAGGVSTAVSAGAGAAPPGYYMLFVLNTQGVPSVAKWVRLTG